MHCTLHNIMHDMCTIGNLGRHPLEPHNLQHHHRVGTWGDGCYLVPNRAMPHRYASKTYLQQQVLMGCVVHLVWTLLWVWRVQQGRLLVEGEGLISGAEEMMMHRWHLLQCSWQREPLDPAAAATHGVEEGGGEGKGLLVK